MPEVCNLLSAAPVYRREAFTTGLVRLGYQESGRAAPAQGNVLVLWNRRGAQHRMARAYEAAGGTVLVAENGYIGTAAADGGKLYAIAKGHHNGAGVWPVGGPERWASLNIELAPWRSVGQFVLVLLQRGIGAPGVAMPPTWPQTVLQQLKGSGRPVKIRHHPGHEKTDPLPDLRGAHAAITWGSGAGIKALVAGYPVFHALGSWIGAAAACGDLAQLAAPPMPDRLPMLERLAWAQWSLAEIETGEAFEWLLRS